jgi:hypothetical protein
VIKTNQWKAFLRKGKLETEGKVFSEIIDITRNFLMPPALAAAANKAFEMVWLPQGPWQPKKVNKKSKP